MGPIAKKKAAGDQKRTAKVPLEPMVDPKNVRLEPMYSQSDSLQRHKIDMEKLLGPTDGQLGTHSQMRICGFPLARKTYQKCGFR